MLSLHVPLTPSFLVAAANAFIGVDEQGGDNRGQMVERFLRGVSLPPGQPWCAAFVHHVGYWSHYDHALKRSSWPLPATGSCETLAFAARSRGALRTEPLVGDVFLLYSRLRGRFVHTGVVVDIDDHADPLARDVHSCLTVEGNTNADGSPNGNAILRKRRTFRTADGHRFIRWAELTRRAEAA